MPVDLPRVPAERAPAIDQGREREHVGRLPERLLAVQIDDDGEPPETVMGGVHDRLPDRALVALGVAHEDEDAALRALEARRERGADAHRQPESQRAGRKIDAGELPIGVDAEVAPVAAVRVERRLIEPAAEEQGSVDREHGVALCQHEAVAIVCPRRRHAEHASVQRRDDVGDRQGRADVAHVRPLRLFDDDPPDFRSRHVTRLALRVSCGPPPCQCAALRSRRTAAPSCSRCRSRS